MQSAQQNEVREALRQVPNNDYGGFGPEADLQILFADDRFAAKSEVLRVRS